MTTYCGEYSSVRFVNSMADFIAVEEGASEKTHCHLLRVQLLLRIEGEAFSCGRKEQARKCLISTNHQMTALATFGT